MTEVPKIVSQRLRAAEVARQVEQTHPEADVLAAFAERTLSPRERENVLAHLASCVDCRAAVILTLPAAEPVAQIVDARADEVSAPVHLRSPRNWFVFANLRWAAMAAGVALAVLLARPGLEQLERRAGNHTAVSVQPPSAQELVASGQGMKTETGEMTEARGAADTAGNRKVAPVPTPLGGEPKAMNGDHRAQAVFNKKADSRAAATSASNARKDQGEAMESTATIAGAAPIPSNRLGSRNDQLAIVRAKPAPGETSVEVGTQKPSAQAQTVMQAGETSSPTVPAAVLKQTPQWTVEEGVLKRSVDGGRSWQKTVQTEHVLLCYATRGRQVWAGGEAGTLLYSGDGGSSWNTIAIAFQGQALNSNITNIDVQASSVIALTTSNDGIWTSPDGGKTWEKK
jgi:hypothetical protein